MRWTEAEKILQDKDQAKLRELLGSESYDKAYLFGTDLSPQQAVELALGRTATA